MINIREMEIKDYEQLINLWSNTENIGLSNADSHVNLAGFLSRNPGLSFVAEDDDQIIGTILGGHDGRRGAIYHLAVDKNSRNKGIGNQLLEKCVAAFAAIGIERCHIHVYADTQAGIEFWQKNGWFTRPALILLSKDISGDVKIHL